jgi:YHS domain-containing protein
MVTAPAATFVFADIAGFTALTEAHGDEEAVALVTRFAESVEAELPAGGEELVSGQMAALVPELEGVVYESRGLHVLRNVAEPIELFAALPVGASAERLSIDPVCRMAVDPERAPGRLLHNGTAYYFCSLTCAGDFAREPARFKG